MDAYCAEICKLKGHFKGIEFQHVPRNNNVATAVLSKLARLLSGFSTADSKFISIVHQAQMVSAGDNEIYTGSGI
jgi:hypothetical protein